MAILYKMIYDELFNQITQGFYKVGDKLPSEKELSDMYSVSRITSKKALEELERNQYVKRIRGKGTFLIKEVKPSKYASENFTNNQKEIIAIIFPSVHDFGHFSLTVEAMTKVIIDNGYKPNLYYRFSNIEEIEQLLVQLKKDKVKGVIYFPYSLLHSYEILNSYKYENVPLVTIDKYFQCLDIKTVCSDNFKGGMLATDYLIELGHKKIGFVSDVSIEAISSVRDRYFGYCKSLEKANLQYNSDYISIDKIDLEFNRNFDEEKYIKMVQNFYDSGVTAIIAINDIVASYIFQVAKLLNINIPNDLSIVGFDGILFSEYQEIPLTSVLQDFTKIGKEAAHIIIDEINNNKRNSMKTLPMSLVKRASCAPPRKTE
ncbi:MAG: GntR family transcriptional regulator [Pleomorphochaeta sp.]